MNSHVFQQCFSKMPDKMEPSVVLQSRPTLNPSSGLGQIQTFTTLRAVLLRFPWTNSLDEKIHTSEVI